MLTLQCVSVACGVTAEDLKVDEGHSDAHDGAWETVMAMARVIPKGIHLMARLSFRSAPSVESEGQHAGHDVQEMGSRRKRSPPSFH